MNTDPWKKAPLGVSLGLFALLCTGCGTSTGKMSGTVSYKNKPLAGGIVIFVTAQGSANGTIDTAGGYTVDNVPVGTAKISVFTGGGGGGGPIMKGPKDRMTTPKDLPPEAQKALQGSKQGSTLVAIPPKYADPNTSDLSVEVKSGQNPPFNIDLKD